MGEGTSLCSRRRRKWRRRWEVLPPPTRSSPGPPLGGRTRPSDRPERGSEVVLPLDSWPRAAPPPAAPGGGRAPVRLRLARPWWASPEAPPPPAIAGSWAPPAPRLWPARASPRRPGPAGWGWPPWDWPRWRWEPSPGAARGPGGAGGCSRFWLVINKEGNMVTARQEPRLVLISLTCEGDTLTLSAAYTKDLQLPIKTPTTNVVHKCRVHGLEIEGRDCGEAAAQWITNFLKTQPYRLVHFEPHMQPRNSHQVEDAFRPTDQIPYSDASPFLILSEASLADLNSRLEKKVKTANFRPNIVISGCGVYAEDSWNGLLIGDVELKRVMACSRCILTTVDPDTGVMSRKEPLETLKSYRLCDPSERKLYGKSPLFGQYFVLENPGTIHVGDPVYLLGQE
ncbi:mitochondrial amidoxime-reducing component 1 isoform X1 [Odocoileus virginianus]|uniref:Mitochondrial amidoxime-reducing component 1 isoform X1 n=1 Tax=Odocoileus virginianus TaxID=9874 RepID=A0ABM4IRZ4_ODOVR